MTLVSPHDGGGIRCRYIEGACCRRLKGRGHGDGNDQWESIAVAILAVLLPPVGAHWEDVRGTRILRVPPLSETGAMIQLEEELWTGAKVYLQHNL